MSDYSPTTRAYVDALAPALPVGTGGGCTAIAVTRPEWSRWGFGILVTDNDLNWPGHESGPVGDGTAISFGITSADWIAEPSSDIARALCEVWEGIYDGESIPGDSWPDAATVAAAVVAFGDRVAAHAADLTSDNPATLTPARAAIAAGRAGR